MNMRWLAAGIAAVLITGGGATLAQRAITQKTRGVLPDGTDTAHADTRRAAQPVAVAVPMRHPEGPTLALASTPPTADAPASPAVEPEPSPMPATNAPAPEAMPALADAGVGEAPAAPTEVVPTPAEASPAAADPAVSAASTESQDAVRPVNRSNARPSTRISADEGTPAQPAPAVETAAAKADPVQSVEEFVERNRKEAEQAIQDLSTEAEDLKARLAKVETALVRWHSFSRALKADQPGPQTEIPVGGKSGWKRLEPTLTSQPANVEATPAGPLAPPMKLEGPSSAVPPAASSPTPGPEIPTTPTVPPTAEPAVPSAEPTLPPPAEPRPSVPPAADPPVELPGPAAEPKPGS